MMFSQEFRQKALLWANTYDEVCYFDSNDYQGVVGAQFDCLLAIGSKRSITINIAIEKDAFEKLYHFWNEKKSWLFGYLGYDLKNDVEKLSSANDDILGFPDLYFFEPQHLIIFENEKIIIISDEKDILLNEIEKIDIQNYPHKKANKFHISPKVAKEDYLQIIQKIKTHIVEGDIYEMNFCQAFVAENALIDPLCVFQKLNNITRAPFAAYFKHQHQYLMCASPERYLQKKGQQLISQPIKGTIRRDESDYIDKQLAAQLLNSNKDRAEHIMIVDLVRNDLARICETNSVVVQELFGIYSFRTVHQMISTIKGTLKKKNTWADTLKATFPMGSMTGAPKVMSMELIEKYENTKRGMYSGAIGYISPEGDFDFNVIIRSILYNGLEQYLSLSVGGAIVFDSDAQSEYEECLLKANAMLRALANDIL